MKDRSVVLNVMSGSSGEVLDRNRTHVVRKDADGKIYAAFENPGQEDNTIKLTLTALSPFTEFETAVNGHKTGMKRANAAGILECRIVLLARQKLTVKEL